MVALLLELEEFRSFFRKISIRGHEYRGYGWLSRSDLMSEAHAKQITLLEPVTIMVG